MIQVSLAHLKRHFPRNPSLTYKFQYIEERRQVSLEEVRSASDPSDASLSPYRQRMIVDDLLTLASDYGQLQYQSAYFRAFLELGEPSRCRH